jgi:hypothetical protein
MCSNGAAALAVCGQRVGVLDEWPGCMELWGQKVCVICCSGNHKGWGGAVASKGWEVEHAAAPCQTCRHGQLSHFMIGAAAWGHSR